MNGGIFAHPSTSTFTSSRGNETLTTLSLVSGFPPVAAAIRVASSGPFAVVAAGGAALGVTGAGAALTGDVGGEGAGVATVGGAGVAGGGVSPPQAESIRARFETARTARRRTCMTLLQA
jgi:hypothetical protein